MFSFLLQEKSRSYKEWTENIYQILRQHSIATIVQLFQGESLLLTSDSLGVPGTLLIDLTMKPPIGF